MNAVSVVIIARKSAATLRACLNSVAGFDEVVLYLNDTDDDSREIAHEFANVRVIEGYFDGFGSTKNRAADCARNDWILSLDADEALGAEMAQTVLQQPLNPHSVYAFERINYYRDRPIRHCWGHDTLVRLYNRTHTQFTDSRVHEFIRADHLTVERSRLTFTHHPYHSLSDFLVKADTYSTLFAQENVGRKTASPAKAFADGLYSFIKTYFFKRGFLDGYAGLVIAFSHMATNFYKYMKLYEANQSEQEQKP